MKTAARKNKTRAANRKPKAESRKPKMRSGRTTKKMKKKPVQAVHTPMSKKRQAASVTPIRDRMDGRIFTDSREYDRRVYVRFDAAGKDLVKATAGDAGLSPYIAHFATEAAKSGKELLATPATPRETGVFARFESPAVKKMVRAAAAKCGVSLSAYAAYFAVEAAKAGKKMTARAVGSQQASARVS